jgi:hypothetical protein
MVEIQTHEFNFPGFKGDGPQQQDWIHSFSGEIQEFAVFLSGFQMQYNTGDHHLGQAIVNVKGEKLNPLTIQVKGELGLRDWSGKWDDLYSGFIRYTVIAEIT